MSNIIDFEIERAKRKSGINDPAVLEDMLNNNYDPCDPDEVNAYWINCKLLDGFSTEPITFTLDEEYLENIDFGLFSDDN